jgi:hypothetical protein
MSKPLSRRSRGFSAGVIWGVIWGCHTQFKAEISKVSPELGLSVFGHWSQFVSDAPLLSSAVLRGAS